MKKDPTGNIQLLTYGETTYRSEARQSSHFVKPNDWQLRLSRSGGSFFSRVIIFYINLETGFTVFNAPMGATIR